MADGKFDLKLIPELDGSVQGLAVVEWFEKAEHDLCGVKNIASILPLGLMDVHLLCSKNSARKKEKI